MHLITVRCSEDIAMHNIGVSKPEVIKIRPMGQIWPTNRFDLAYGQVPANSLDLACRQPVAPALTTM